MSKIGKFIISLDFELHWGGVEIWDLKEKKEYFENTVKYIPSILKIFEENEIKATWATVGFLFANNKEQLIKFSPELKPTYDNQKLNYYNIFPILGENEKDDIFHYAPSLINLILRTPGQELASHTFAHYYCTETGQTSEQFDADLKSAQRIAKTNFGVTLKSLVFPRNQFNEEYIKIARKNGFTVVRSNPNIWFWENKYIKFSALVRAFDTLFSIGKSLSFDEVKTKNGVTLLPASRFFRPYKPKEKIIQSLKMRRIKKEMTYAAKNRKNYHLWWHPHNFSDDIDNNIKQLIEIINHYKFLSKKYGFTSSTMENHE